MLFEKQAAQSPLTDVMRKAGEIILGKDQQIRMAMCCILARGHLLIEDVPGVGKTTLSHVLVDFRPRIQHLPLSPRAGVFAGHPGR